MLRLMGKRIDIGPTEETMLSFTTRILGKTSEIDKRVSEIEKSCLDHHTTQENQYQKLSTDLNEHIKNVDKTHKKKC